MSASFESDNFGRRSSDISSEVGPEPTFSRVKFVGSSAVDYRTDHKIVPVLEPAENTSELAENMQRGALNKCADSDCDGELAYPYASEEAPDDNWMLHIRCPECELRTSILVTQEEAEVFDDVLNYGSEELRDSLRDQERSNLEEDIERLIDLIKTDRIFPMDF